MIQNPQGAGKILLFSKLALYADWFAEGISIDLDKKDSVIQATGCWIAELGELDSTLKREQLSLKAFITSRTDTYRQPYARAATRKPRRTSFGQQIFFYRFGQFLWTASTATTTTLNSQAFRAFCQVNAFPGLI